MLAGGKRKAAVVSAGLGVLLQSGEDDGLVPPCWSKTAISMTGWVVGLTTNTRWRCTARLVTLGTSFEHEVGRLAKRPAVERLHRSRPAAYRAEQKLTCVGSCDEDSVYCLTLLILQLIDQGWCRRRQKLLPGFHESQRILPGAF